MEPIQAIAGSQVARGTRGSPPCRAPPSILCRAPSFFLPLYNVAMGSTCFVRAGFRTDGMAVLGRAHGQALTLAA